MSFLRDIFSTFPIKDLKNIRNGNEKEPWLAHIQCIQNYMFEFLR